MKKLLTFAKGKLTVASIAGYLASGHLLEAIDTFNQIPQTFEAGAGTGTWIDLVFGIGAAWGILRRFTKTYKDSVK